MPIKAKSQCLIEDLQKHPKMVEYSCPRCHKPFGRSPKYGPKYCSRECYSPLNSYLKKVSKKESGRIKQSLKMRKEYGQLTEKYKNQIIDYPEAPTKKAYVGFNKLPLMKTETGIGFQGVILQDETRSLVQCYECGQWLQSITNTHLKKHQITVKQYKDKFSLKYSKGICSDALSSRYAVGGRETLLNQSKEKKEAFLKLAIKNLPKAVNASQQKQSIARRNKYGTCPLQLLQGLINFINRFHYLPGPSNLGRTFYKNIKTLYKCSFPKALRLYGLPYFNRKGSTMFFTFSDNTKYDYNVNQGFDQEILYQMMKEKCAILTAMNLETYLPKQSDLLEA